jgi:hypothetical protein
MIEDKFDRLTSYFYEIKENLLSQNILNFNPFLDSKWLYLKTEDSTYATNAEFTTSFDLIDRPDEAYLQILGDTYVKLYINGKFIDKVYARRSLSLLVDYRRIMFIDIKPFLIIGKNSINIIAESFSKQNGAGFNLIASIKSGDKEIIIKSDDSKSSEIKWLGHETNRNSWKEVVSKPYSYEIIAPNFKTKRSSWIER